MKISYIRIENFRGVQSLELKFGDRMNVFVGENGAGKSTVLSALKYLMSWFTARMQSREGSGIFIKEEDITNAMPFCRLQIRLDDGTYWKLFRQRKNVREKAWDKTDLTELTALTDRLVAEHDDKNETIPYPMIAHYGVNRAVTEAKPELEKKSKMKPSDAYDGKLNNGAKR